MDLFGDKKVNIAAIDIGTNTVLMTIKNNSTGEIIGDFQKIARLGEKIHETKIIQPQSLERFKLILREYHSLCNLHRVEKVRLIATSAMRDANNKSEIVSEIKKEFNWNIEIIKGEEEANLTFLGGIDGLIFSKNIPLGLIDIGGGSTEYILGNSEKVNKKISLNIGTVRLSEKFRIHNVIPKASDIREFTQFVQNDLTTIPFRFPDETQWLGVAGTVTSLAAIKHKLLTYQPEFIHGSEIFKHELESFTSEFSTIHPDEILQRYPILGKRFDVILAGCLILLESFKFFNIQKMTVSDRGLRYGVLNNFVSQFHTV